MKTKLIINFLISAYDYPYGNNEDELLISKYSYQDIQNIAEIAQRENLSSLRFISSKSKTYFNEKQVLNIINKEIPILKSYKNINTDILEHIIKIADFVINEGFYFLKIEPIIEISD
jgi:hypothetical protein